MGGMLELNLFKYIYIYKKEEIKTTITNVLIMLLLKLDSSCNMHIFKYRYKNLKHFERLFTSRNHRLLRVCAPLYVENTAIWRKKEENCLTPDGSKQLKIQSSGALSDMGYIFSEQSNRLRRQQGITYTGAGQL